MNEKEYHKIVRALEETHRNLALLTLNQSIGASVNKKFSDILTEDSILLRPSLINDLRMMADSSADPEEQDRIERVLISCMDLAIEAENSSLSDMLRFYLERGRMVVQGQKIPAMDIVPWLQKQDVFELREEMRNEIGIFSRAIINPILLSILDLTIRKVTEQFGFENYARYTENKRSCSFEDWQRTFLSFLSNTDDEYYKRTRPWAEERLGRPLEDLNRCHALRLLRIDTFDKYFSKSSLIEIIQKTFAGLGLDLNRRKDIIIDEKADPRKNPNAICVPIELPGKIHVIIKPIGGLIDLEALLHEMGHAFFLSGFSVDAPVEYRRLYRTAALDESLAFLFTQLLENPLWLMDVAKLKKSDAEKLSAVSRTKRLLLIRRHIGKFMAEKELFQYGNFKDSGFYCNWLNRSTGFNYEPDGYLIDMDPDFYSAEYVWAWAGAEILREYLENSFGSDWFQSSEAGSFLGKISLEGRKNSLEQALSKFCGATLSMPQFSAN
ncbi:MAG: hypothetical protein NTY51_05100 [Deltaproteobacteria bacterium]|nr:hypothetical protein [Deltaproteobacteria bacterium]